MGSLMLGKARENTEAVNEILDMYRFIVDKYANMVMPMPGSDLSVIDFLVKLLIEQWTHFHT